MLITRRLEFDAGHRIPDHRSQCRHLHGHRYVIEITLSGNIIDKAGDAANGMVMDFSQVKDLAKAASGRCMGSRLSGVFRRQRHRRFPEFAARPQDGHPRPGADRRKPGPYRF